jgi:predicted MFS family arabinose efflux permease
LPNASRSRRFIVIADLTRGTGRYNLAQGAASASWGLGAALSNSVAGFIVDKAGFSAAFLFLAGCALAAFLLLWIAMPETGDPSEKGHGIIVATSSLQERRP